MGKRNKIRYQSKPKVRIPIVLTGKAYLLYVEDEALQTPAKGDLMVYPQNDALHSLRQGDYYSTGFSGYFKVDVWDGKQWCAVIIQGIFPDGEHRFTKKECPIDTYAVCKEILVKLAGSTLVRTYREHYEPEEL